MVKEAESVEEAETTEDVTSLSDMFDESEVEAKADTEEEKGEVEEPETEEVTAEAETPETEPETPAESPSAEQGQMAALLAERQRRQEAERKLAELETQEPVPDPIEDPEGYAKHLQDNNAKSALDTRIELSREIMVETDPDYVELEQEFMGMVVDSEGVVIDTSLLQQFQQDKFPARFARDHAKAQRELKKLTDPKYLEKLKAEWRVEVLAEIQAESKKGVPAVDVPNLTNAAAGSNSSVKEVPLTLEGMFEE